MNGLEACRRLKAHDQTAHIPILMLTAHHHITEVMRGLDLGATDFIPKDAFSTVVLLETLRQLQIL
jgi:DNA-binding response OmpR family regulator